MCLVVFAWQVHPDFPLVLAANRDEFHRRPAQALRWWADEPAILGGRDLQAGGTWLALARSGRIATVTNYREGHAREAARRSRGELVTQFLTSEDSPGDYVNNVSQDDYAGFNLLIADREQIAYTSNRGDAARILPPGVYGLSNASLDTPWWKLEQTRDGLANLIAENRVNETTLLRMMANKQKAPVDDVPTGPLPFEIGRALTAPFIVTAEYGTRCTSVILQRQDGQTFVTERRFDSSGKATGDSHIDFAITG